MSLVEDLRYNKRMSDFVTHCVGVIEGIWGGCKFLVPVLFVSVCVKVMELSNQVYEYQNAANALFVSVCTEVVELSNQVYELKDAADALKEDLEDDDSDDYTTEEN